MVLVPTWVFVVNAGNFALQTCLIVGDLIAGRMIFLMIHCVLWTVALWLGIRWLKRATNQVVPPPPQPWGDQINEAARFWEEEAHRVGIRIGEYRVNDGVYQFNGVLQFNVQQADEQAELKALALLLSHLTLEQEDSYERHGYFDVKGSDGNWYRIRKDRAYNVLEMDHMQQFGRVKWCAFPHIRPVRPRPGIFAYNPHDPSYQLPMGDQLLAQKLMIETDVARFKSIANRG